MEDKEIMPVVAGNEEMQTNVTLEIQEKVNTYNNYIQILDGVIGCAVNEKALDKIERIRLTKFLNSARYHCVGRIESIMKSNGGAENEE